jgi:hypothetical protein
MVEHAVEMLLTGSAIQNPSRILVEGSLKRRGSTRRT